MRGFLTVPVRRRMGARREELRFFQMTPEQAVIYEACLRGLVKKGMREEDADKVLIKIAQRMLQGAPIPPNAGEAMRKLRNALPILSDADVRKMPRKGCPRGRFQSLIFPITIVDAETKETEMALVRFDMSPHQKEVFHQVMDQLRRTRGIRRDEAFEKCHQLVGRLVAGAELVDRPDPLSVRLAEVFASIDGRKLPLATTDDIRRFQFVEDDPS